MPTLAGALPRRAAAGYVSPRAVLVVMCVGYFLVLLDVTIVNVALPKIGAGLDAGVSGLQWVVDGYALALASLMLAGGTVGDLHGHRRVVLAGLIVFWAGSLLCGVAPTTGVLVAARLAQGVGAALLLPGTLAIISRAFPEPRAQARAIGIWAAIGSLALPAGPLAGGLLIHAFGWRAVFLVNVPIVVVALVVAARLVRESVDPADRRLDRAGVVLGVLLLVAATFAFIQAGRSGAGSPAVIAAAGAAVVLVVAFVLVERRRGDRAMLPLTLLRRRQFSVANADAATMNLCMLGTLVRPDAVPAVDAGPLAARGRRRPRAPVRAAGDHRPVRGAPDEPDRPARPGRRRAGDCGRRTGAARVCAARLRLRHAAARVPALGRGHGHPHPGGGRGGDWRGAGRPGGLGVGDQQHRPSGGWGDWHRGGRRDRRRADRRRQLRQRLPRGGARRRRPLRDRRGGGSDPAARLAMRLLVKASMVPLWSSGFIVGSSAPDHR